MATAENKAAKGAGGRDGLYDEADLANCCDKVELVDFHQVVEHNGIRFWSYNAGHVLGAAMFYIEIGGVACCTRATTPWRRIVI